MEVLLVRAGPRGGVAKWASVDKADSGLGERGERSKGRRSHKLISWKNSPDAESLNLRSRCVTSLCRSLCMYSPHGRCVLVLQGFAFNFEHDDTYVVTR